MLYVVLNNLFQPCSPDNTGFNKSAPEYAHLKNTYFMKDYKEVAMKFAEFLAQKFAGQKFYLFESLDYVQTIDPPVRWMSTETLLPKT